VKEKQEERLLYVYALLSSGGRRGPGVGRSEGQSEVAKPRVNKRVEVKEVAFDTEKSWRFYGWGCRTTGVVFVGDAGVGFGGTGVGALEGIFAGETGGAP
jgi:hypothetical protein